MTEKVLLIIMDGIGINDRTQGTVLCVDKIVFI